MIGSKLTESNDTSVVDLGLDKRGVVKVAGKYVREGEKTDPMCTHVFVPTSRATPPWVALAS